MEHKIIVEIQIIINKWLDYPLQNHCKNETRQNNRTNYLDIEYTRVGIN